MRVVASAVGGRGARRVVSLPPRRRWSAGRSGWPTGRPADVRPFSDAVLVGRTLYLAGRTGHDKDGKLPADAADEARAVMDQIKSVLVQEGMTMDDLAYVQVFCTDVKLYDSFNGVYRTYFKKFPARAFIGSGPLLGNARFEVQGIAEKR